MPALKGRDARFTGVPRRIATIEKGLLNSGAGDTALVAGRLCTKPADESPALEISRFLRQVHPNRKPPAIQ
jgi:hypothetical protein